MASVDTLKTRRQLTVGDKTYAYYSLPAAEEAGLSGISRLPISMKVLLENLLRYEDGRSVTVDDIKAVAKAQGELRERAEQAYILHANLHELARRVRLDHLTVDDHHGRADDPTDAPRDTVGRRRGVEGDLLARHPPHVR